MTRFSETRTRTENYEFPEFISVFTEFWDIDGNPAAVLPQNSFPPHNTGVIVLCKSKGKCSRIRLCYVG